MRRLTLAQWALSAAALGGVLHSSACSDETSGAGATPIGQGGAGGAGGAESCLVGEAPNPAGGCCPIGSAPLADGSCQAAGIPATLPCPPGQAAQQGGCQPAGIGPDDCADGFVHDGDSSCEPVLPAAPCPAGMMATVGETECREIAPCGQGTWGDIPVEADTEYVDGAYAGGDSDGSADRPWTTIDDGIEAAAQGAIVAVAAGSYVEDVHIASRPVRLWGRCPELVEIVGSGDATAAIVIQSMKAVEVHDLATTGAAMGVSLFGSEHVLLDRLWIHDTLDWGLYVVDWSHPASATVTGSLIEKSWGMGLAVFGSEMLVEASVVRDTQSLADGTFGRAIYVGYDPTQQVRADVTIRSAVVESNPEFGIVVAGADAIVEASVVRDIRADGNGSQGWGIAGVSYPGSGELAALAVRSSVVERNTAYGIQVSGGELSIETTAVRDTLLDEEGVLGHGVSVLYDPIEDAQAKLTLLSSVVEDSPGVGVMVISSDATIEKTLVRQSQPITGDDERRGIAAAVHPDSHERPNVTIRSSRVEGNGYFGVGLTGADATVETTVVSHTVPTAAGTFGRGIYISDSESDGPSHVTIRHCLVEGNHEGGVIVIDSDATIETSEVRGTLPLTGLFGRGISIQSNDSSVLRAHATIRSCLVDSNHEAGVLVAAADATIETSVVRSNLPNENGMLGDGIAVFSGAPDALATAVLDRCLVESNARAGVASFGAAVSLEWTKLACNSLDLAAEEHYLGVSVPPTLHDLGGNVCGCSPSWHDCVATSSGLQPPESLGD